jgi:GA4 desaturase
LTGLKRTARYCRKDITAAAQEALDAEDNGTEPKRYAAYSVWRPLKAVKRDPLAVADWRTVDPSTLQAIEYRATSNVLESGEYMLEQRTQTPDAKSTRQKWFCKPNQQTDDVLILKFADTATEKDPKIAASCVHCSPVLHGAQDEEPRMSVEARVIAFW